MTLDHAVALSLLDRLPRPGLTARLTLPDPELMELAAAGCARAREVRTAAATQGIRVAAWNDDDFPAWLRTIGDCPPALWYRGSLDALARAPAVAIVGSRAASAVALETASRMAADLAAAGLIVVSGLARGVDSAAHRGAISMGTTLAVLGSGVDCIYPAEHARLATDIARTGAIVSEYPPATPPLPFHFPMRNRLISGLSRAVIVIEAAEGSGSLITVASALEQGREVMAVPGNVLSGRNRGGHALLRDGATIVESAADVLDALGFKAIVPRGNNDGSATSGDPVLDTMTAGEPCDIDTLASRSGLPAARLLPRLATLELRGLVRRVAGGRFVRP